MPDVTDAVGGAETDWPPMSDCGHRHYTVQTVNRCKQWRERETFRAPEVPGARPVAEVTDDALDLTEVVDGDTYVAVLWARAALVQAEGNPVPPNITWFCRARDEPFVIVPGEVKRPEPVRRPSRAPRPRRPVDLEALRAQRDRLVAQRDAIGSWRSDDPAATRLKPKVARRVQERGDRDLTRYVELGERISKLEARILTAEHAKPAPGSIRRVSTCAHCGQPLTQTSTYIGWVHDSNGLRKCPETTS